MSDFNIITVDHVKKMRTFEQHVLRIRFFELRSREMFQQFVSVLFILDLELQPCVTRGGVFLCNV